MATDPTHEHSRPVDDFGFTGADLDLFAGIVAGYRKVGYGVIYAKHYAHGIIDAIRHDAPHGDLDPKRDQSGDSAATGSELDIARRCADIFAHVYEIHYPESDAGAHATRAAEAFRDDYIDWLTNGIAGSILR